MKRFLKVGDIFKSKKIGEKAKGTLISKAKYKIDDNPNQPVVTFSLLKLDNFNTTTVSYKLVNGDWYQDRNLELNLSAKHLNLENQSFIVTKTDFCGGSNSLHDPWPDGHYVEAESFPVKKYKIIFFQSGCFTNLLVPEEVEMIQSTSNILDVKLEFNPEKEMNLEDIKIMLKNLLEKDFRLLQVKGSEDE